MFINKFALRKPSTSLVLAIGLAIATIDHAGAAALNPGESATVNDGDTVEDWSLRNATLLITPGGKTGAIQAQTGSSVTIDGGTVTSSTTSGISLLDSDVTLANTNVTSTASYGIIAATDIGGTLRGSKITAVNSVIQGVARGVSASFNSIVTLDRTSVYGSGTGIDGAVNGGVGMVLVGATATVQNGSTITGDNRGVVMVSDRFANSEKSTLTLDNSSATGLTGSAIFVTEGDIPNSVAAININNGSTLTGGNGVILEVEKNSTVQFNVNNSRLIGDVLVESGSVVDLDLQNHASLVGKITNATSLTLDDSSRWTMEGDSSVGKLALNGGFIDLRGTATNSFHQLDASELSGAGTFALRTDLDAGLSDKIVISGNATGNHNLLIENTGNQPQAGAEDQQVVHIGGGDAGFAVIGGLVDTGTYAYELQQRADGSGGTDWYLAQTGELSRSAEVAIGLFSAAPTIWYGESSTLRSRMGELRIGKNEGGGWMRTYGNKLDMSAGSDVEYSQQQQGISFGADMPVSNSGGQWLIGLMGGYSKSDLDLKAGNKGKVDSYYVGAYSTWLADNGFYIDALIKANRFKNSADVTMRDGVKTKGDYTNHGIGGSVEVGKHITFADDWFVEPYAQVSTLWVSGKDYTLDNGLDASSNQADSLLGKLGNHIGRKFALKDGGFVQPYVKAAVAREFVTSNEVTINDTRFDNDLSGTRLEVGAGIAAQLTDVLQVHADFDYMKGSNIEQPWGINLGARYNW